MSWYLAPSLAVLRAEINARWPNRDKTSDGSIGDAAHQASASDHNPNSRGSVDAIDVDKDGVDVAAIIAAFQRHPSAHYWIYNRQIADRDDGWRRRPYTGPNPHDKHLHGSIRQSRAAEQDQRPWGLLEDEMSEAEIIAALRKGVSSDPTIREALRQAPWEFKPADHGGNLTAHAIVINGVPVTLGQLAQRIDQVAARVEQLATTTGLDPAALADVIADRLAGRLAE